MRKTKLAALIAAAGFAAVAPSMASATTPTANVADTTYAATPVDNDDDDFPWGLLGLLGLAGLLGRKRNDDHVVHTDNNRTTRP